MDLDAKKFETIISSFHNRLLTVPPAITSHKPAPDKWSLKEIVGHLIDSASNNHQRFVRLQEVNSLSLPGYDQENWIRIQRYNRMDWDDLVALWYLMNILLLHIIRGIPRGSLGNLYQSPEGPVPLDALVNDYFRHMQGHMQHFEERYAGLSAADHYGSSHSSNRSGVNRTR